MAENLTNNPLGGVPNLVVVLNPQENPQTEIASSNSRNNTQMPQGGVQRVAPARRVITGNLFRVIRELQPFVETARTVNGISISNLLSRTTVEEQNGSNSVVINLEGIQEERVEPVQNPRENEPNDETGEALNQLAEIQQHLQIFKKYLPFLFILAIKSLYDHCDGLINLLILIGTFLHVNGVVKQEATKQGRKSYSKLLLALLYSICCVLYMNYVFLDEKLYLNLILLQNTKETSVLNLLWMIAVADFVLKLFTVFFKILIIMLPVRIIPHHKRGKIYLFIEAFSQLYRGLATVEPWLVFLLEFYDGTEKIVGVFLSAIYMVSKGGDLMASIKLFKNATVKLLQNVSLGYPPTKEQMHVAGNSCPICHDVYECPVLLQCKHIFCEGCVTTWFDREQTCPLCRAKIVDDPTWRDGSTSLLVQLF